MGRFRASSLGSGAIILALLLLILHRNGTGLLFLVIGGALLWYGRSQREAQDRAAREGEGADRGADRGADGGGEDAPVEGAAERAAEPAADSAADSAADAGADTRRRGEREG